MKRIFSIAGLLVLAVVIAGCSPTITVNNKTTIPVRAIVSTGEFREIVSPSPGESSYVIVSESGAYNVTVIPDAEWIAYAKATRQFLNEQLANSDQLTGAQLLEVIRRLKDIAARMYQFEQAAGTSAKCGGRVSEEQSGIVTISIAPDGKLAAACR